MRRGQLLDGDGRLLLYRAWRTRGVWERTRGLLGKPAPDPGEGLIIFPCNGIHTFFMLYDIDAAYLDAKGTILKVVAHLPPWRFSRCAEAAAVIEMRAGEAARVGLQPGIETRWQPY
jgi:uncharacterized membrane protein (UPF0127 family)